MSAYRWIFDSDKLSFSEKLEKACEFAKHKVEMRVNQTLKLGFKQYLIWSEFENSRLVEGKWVTESVFYFGDLEGSDFKNDWRFKEVKGKRKQAIFKGLCCIEKKGDILNKTLNHPNVIIKYLGQEDNGSRFNKWVKTGQAMDLIRTP